jgi:hypothetical protein
VEGGEAVVVVAATLLATGLLVLVAVSLATGAEAEVPIVASVFACEEEEAGVVEVAAFGAVLDAAFVLGFLCP